MSDFKGRHFRGEIVLWAVRWYCRYAVSYRDLEAMMTERGVAVDHSTIDRWVQRFAATAGVKWSVIGQFENVARKGDRGPVPSRQAAKKTVNQRDIEEDARRSPALPLRPFSCTFGTALTVRSGNGETPALAVAPTAVGELAN